MAVLMRADERGPFVFSVLGTKPFNEFSKAKRQLNQLCAVTGWRLHDLRRTCVSGMARLGIAPHVADKILNHPAGSRELRPYISGTSFSRSEGRHSNDGGLTLPALWPNPRVSCVAESELSHDALVGGCDGQTLWRAAIFLRQVEFTDVHHHVGSYRLRWGGLAADCRGDGGDRPNAQGP
jgi:hypothetical protein